MQSGTPIGKADYYNLIVRDENTDENTDENPRFKKNKTAYFGDYR